MTLPDRLRCPCGTLTPPRTMNRGSRKSNLHYLHCPVCGLKTPGGKPEHLTTYWNETVELERERMRVRLARMTAAPWDMAQADLLRWLAKWEPNLVGECSGPALDALIAAGLVEVKPNATRVSDYDHVEVTEAGYVKLHEIGWERATRGARDP